MDSFDTGSQQYFDQNASSGSILVDQNKKKRKKIIIAILAVILGGAAIAAVFVFLNKPSGSGTKPSQVSKEYANYFIFGPDSSGVTDYKLLTNDEFYFYAAGRYDQTYLDAISSKLSDSLNKASNEEQKSAVRTQQELLNFYEVSEIFLNDYTANYEITQPEDGSLSNSYKTLNNYISGEKALAEALQSYENGDISEQEYEDRVLTASINRSALQKERRRAYEQMAQYAKEIYEQ